MPPIPEEILSVLPKDPHELLDLSHNIAYMAIGSVVCQMRQMLHENHSIMEQLEKKVSDLSLLCQEAESRFKKALDENLEKSKRRIVQSLCDYNQSLDETIFDFITSDQSVQTAYPDKVLTDEDGNSPMVDSKVISMTEYPAAGSPTKTSSATSPTKFQNEGRTPRMHGNEFSYQARSQLSYLQLLAFLDIIFDLNNKRLRREDALRKVEQILGTGNKALYLYFEKLVYDKVR